MRGLTIPPPADQLARLAAGPVVVVDTETTGLGPAARLVEIAIVGHDGRVLLSSLVQPGVPIPAAATAVHGLTNADVAGAPTLGHLWPRVRAVLAGQTVIAYNAPFDRQMLHQHALSEGLEPIEADWQCLMRLYAALTRQPRWVALSRACAAERLTFPPSHRAAQDALATHALLRSLLQRQGVGAGR